MANGKLEIEIVGAGGTPGPVGGGTPAPVGGAPAPVGGGTPPTPSAGKPLDVLPATKFDEAISKNRKQQQADFHALVGSLGGPGFGGVAGIALSGAAAGPVGAGMAAFQLMQQASKDAADQIRNMGKFAQGVARLDSGTIADGFEGLAGKIPLLGDSIVAGSQVLRIVFAGLTETANRLSAYSGELAQATAMADVNQILGDINRARFLGPDLAQFTAMRSQVEQDVQDTLATILKEAMPVILLHLEAISVFVRANGRIVEMLAEFRDYLIELPGVKKVLDIIGINTRKDIATQESDKFLEEIFMRIINAGGFAGGGAPGVNDDARRGQERARRVEFGPFQI